MLLFSLEPHIQQGWVVVYSALFYSSSSSMQGWGRPVQELRGPNCMENGSVLGGLLIPQRASWGESLSMRTLPLIIHKACRSKVCSGTQQMVIKSCVLFYWSFLHSCKICSLLLLPFRMSTMLIRNMQRLFVSMPVALMEKQCAYWNVINSNSTLFHNYRPCFTGRHRGIGVRQD